MTATGIVRRIDELGRLVIPKEIRRTLRIRESDPIEIYTDSDGSIVLRKYARIRELNEFAGVAVQSIHTVIGCDALITDTERVLQSAGLSKHKLTNCELSEAYVKAVRKKQNVIWDETTQDKTPLLSGQTEPVFSAMTMPITAHGDVAGSIILLGNSRVRQFGTNEYQMLKVFAVYLGKLLEE